LAKYSNKTSRSRRDGRKNSNSKNDSGEKRALEAQERKEATQRKRAREAKAIVTRERRERYIGRAAREAKKRQQVGKQKEKVSELSLSHIYETQMNRHRLSAYSVHMYVEAVDRYRRDRYHHTNA
jgi:hypothetical protein